MADSPALEIDLHGRTVDAAIRHLLQQLTRARALRMSPVLIITGKGHGSLGGTPTLRPAIRRWLEGPEGRRIGVASIQDAARGGAFLVRVVRS